MPSASNSYLKQPQVQSISTAEGRESPACPIQSTFLENQSPPKLTIVPENCVIPVPATKLSSNSQNQTRIPAHTSERSEQVAHNSTAILNVAQPQPLQPPLPYVAPLEAFAQCTPRQPRSQEERDQRKSSSRKALERFQQSADAIEVGVPVEDVSKRSDRMDGVVVEVDIDVTMADPPDDDGGSGHSRMIVDVPEDDDVVSQLNAF